MSWGDCEEAARARAIGLTSEGESSSTQPVPPHFGPSRPLPSPPPSLQQQFSFQAGLDQDHRHADQGLSGHRSNLRANGKWRRHAMVLALLCMTTMVGATSPSPP
eukprot:scaffold89374_cov66-Phaeocystis_antarctica.AAC.2